MGLDAKFRVALETHRTPLAPNSHGTVWSAGDLLGRHLSECSNLLPDQMDLHSQYKALTQRLVLKISRENSRLLKPEKILIVIANTGLNLR